VLDWVYVQFVIALAGFAALLAWLARLDRRS
jgi:type II secretory pathway component PulM